MGDDRPQIFFDDFYAVRVLEADKFKETEELHDKCKNFVENIGQFSEKVQSIVSFMNAQAKIIEHEKLQALGMRNRVDSEVEIRKRKEKELRERLADKQAEMERLQAQFDSLTKVEQEQKTLIEKLTNNET